jgi:hypothetical protein
MRFRILFVGVPFFLVACATPTDVGSEVMGTIVGYNDDDPRISLTVDALAIEATIVTYGGGCYAFGRTDTKLSDEAFRIDILPFNAVPSASASCSRILKEIPHTVSVPVERPGQYTIVFHGLDAPNQEAVSATQTVFVRAAPFR